MLINRLQPILSRARLHLLLAITFLTRLPLPVRAEVSEDDLRASMAWYPLVGLLLGVIGWGIYYFLCLLLPGSLPAAVITVVVLELCVGALHLDGLMDTADGLGSGRPAARMLEIMKDSNVGAMGVFAALAQLLLKVSLLAALTPKVAWLPLIIGMMAARALPSLNVSFFKYARQTGTGAAFAHGSNKRVWYYAVISTLLISLFIGEWAGILLAAATIMLVLLIQAVISRRLGGLTGDVYGLGIELAETFSLLLGCIIVQWIFI